MVGGEGRGEKVGTTVIAESIKYNLKKKMADINYLGTMGRRLWGPGLVGDTGLELSNWVPGTFARGK